jgi:hypothetical protein
VVWWLWQELDDLDTKNEKIQHTTQPGAHTLKLHSVKTVASARHYPSHADAQAHSIRLQASAEHNTGSRRGRSKGGKMLVAIRTESESCSDCREACGKHVQFILSSGASNELSHPGTEGTSRLLVKLEGWCVGRVKKKP